VGTNRINTKKREEKRYDLKEGRGKHEGDKEERKAMPVFSSLGKGAAFRRKYSNPSLGVLKTKAGGKAKGGKTRNITLRAKYHQIGGTKSDQLITKKKGRSRHKNP